MTAVLLRNVRAWTMDAARPFASALLARDGRIDAVGDERDVLALPAARGARDVDGGGRLVTPGLIDCHTHFLAAARASSLLDLRHAPTLDAALERIAAAHRALAPGLWLVGRGHSMLRWDRRPERADLDRVVGDRPVFLNAKDGHSAWGSSAALAHAGIDRDTLDPPGGRIGRDAAGEPDGLLYENAVTLVARYAPRGGPDDPAALRVALARAHAVGVTGLHDFEGLEAWRAFDALRQGGALSARVWMGFPGGLLADTTGPGLEESLREARGGDDTLALGAIKCFLDGALGARTAHLLEPYEGGSDCGLPTLEPAAFAELGALARRLGLSLCAHAIGDAAVRTALDGFELWPAEARARLRPRVEHAQLVAGADVPRFAQLGVAASMQPQHAVTDRPLATVLWGERDARGGYAWRQLHDAGVRLAFGSDVPVEPCDPRAGLHAALTGGDAEECAAGRRPVRALALADALAAYTRGAAWAAGRDGMQGVLAPGALADWVIWDDDLDALPVERLAGARVGSTWVGGRAVYQRERAVV